MASHSLCTRSTRRVMLLAATAVVALAQGPQAGPQLILNTCGGAATAVQQFTLGAGADANKLYLSSSPAPHMCIDIEGFDTSAGATVYTWPCGSGSKANELWTVSAQSIRSQQTPPTCLAASQAVLGAFVTTAECSDSDPLQALAFSASSGQIVHVASGLCVDAGSPVPAPPMPLWCAKAPQSAWPVCDSSADISVRANDITMRLSLADKFSALGTATPALPSVGLPSYQWWSEATHGLSGPGVHHNEALPGGSNTALPITTSCSFNRSLWHATGNQIGREGRAYINGGMSGSTFWTPVINIVRDPRWGRNLETAGEDPFTSGQYAVSFIKGFEHAKEAPFPLQASTCCKHFVANELDGWNGTNRNHIDSYVPQQDLVDSYLPSFQTCVEEGKVSGIMCSYNAVNGVPSCASDWLLGTLLRDSWQFDGYVTSDCDADSDVFFSHHYTNTPGDAVHDILHAGTDVDCGGFMTKYAPGALTNGTITEEDMNVVLRRLFRVRIRLGHFDSVHGPLSAIGPQDVCTPYALELARDGVRQSAVLAKNAGGVLPLKAAKYANANVVVIGPNVDLGDTTTYYGGTPCNLSHWTPFTAITNWVPGATSIKGVPDVGSSDTRGVAAAAAAAAAADLVILSIGSDLMLEREGHDRLTTNFSDGQLALIAAVTASAKGPVIAMVQSGGAMDVSPLLNNAKVSAVLLLGQPSIQVVGAGDVIFGQTLDGRPVAPAGRMSQMTYPASYVDAVSMFDFGMRPGPSAWPPGTNPGRTYRFYTGTPVLPFGFGLSYTTWTYTPIPGPVPPTVSLSAVHTAAEAHATTGVIGHIPAGLQTIAADFYVNVTNTGTVDSDDVVLGFLVPPGAGVDGVPLQELFGFERVYVPAGQTVTVYLGAQGVRFTQAGTDGVRRVLEGVYKVRFGVRETAALGMGFTEYSFSASV